MSGGKEIKVNDFMDIFGLSEQPLFVGSAVSGL